VKLWELATSRELKRFEGVGRAEVFCVSFAPDGKSVAFNGNEDALYIGDPSTGTFRTLGTYSKPIRALAWSPDGRFIATGSVDPSLRLWDPATGSYTGFNVEDGVFSVAFSPKGDMLAAGGGDWSLRLWELPKK